MQPRTDQSNLSISDSNVQIQPDEVGTHSHLHFVQIFKVFPANLLPSYLHINKYLEGYDKYCGGYI